jgi:predicted RNA polymerase sigma factor
LLRAKRKISAARIPYRIPSYTELADRLTEVLDVLYLVFNEGHLATMGGAPSHRDLADEAAWLTALLCRLLPNEPEPMGLLALMKLHLSRGQSRFDAAGRLVLLAHQDRKRWDPSLISEAIGLIERAAHRARPGPYQLEAAIAACHAEATTFDRTAGYHLFHAARGEMLHELGRREQSRAAQLRALDLTRNTAERALLERRLFSSGDT